MNQIEVVIAEVAATSQVAPEATTAEPAATPEPKPEGGGREAEQPSAVVPESGPPQLRLSGRAAEAARGRSLHLSLTHTDAHASAVVIAEG